MDLELIIKNGFSWIHDQKVYSYLIALLVIGFASLAGISYLTQIFADSILSFNNISIFASNPLALLSTLMEFVFAVILLSVFFGLIQGFVYYLIVLKGMNYYKIKTTEFNAVKYVKLIVLTIVSGLLALISFHEKKFFFAFLGVIGLYVLTLILAVMGQTISLIFLLLAVLATIIYSFIVFYNSIRLSMSVFVFLEKEQGIFESIRESWNLTQGKVIDVFIATLIIGIIVMVIAWISGYLGEMLSYIFFPELMNPNQADPLIVLSMLKENLGAMTFISSIPAIIVGMVMEVFTAYCYAGIYFQVKGKKAI
ncbi:hypothetical protein KKG83_04095 [Candidatus Micrarchaeota archaeon]|nr:hypothetical protein [Candidatus Micrarchaeota archaeon]MBU2476627.1 hypothetical protein [Candidatus Micrarchaeota archaeon]